MKICKHCGNLNNTVCNMCPDRVREGKCKHNIFYIHRLSSNVCRIVDNKVQYSEVAQDGYRITCYSCGYDRTFKHIDKLPKWLTDRINVEQEIDESEEYIPSWRL